MHKINHITVEIRLGTRQLLRLLPREICIFPEVRRQIIAEAKIVYTFSLYKQPGY